MTKSPSGQFETVVKRMLSTPPTPHNGSKAKPGAAKQPVKRRAKKPDNGNKAKRSDD
jgi:hypothetical protein